MATRVTEAEVKEIFPTTMTDEEISPYLCSASTLINGLLAGMGYTNNELRVIELWLAAHFACVRDPAVSDETIGDAAVTYHGSSGLGLNHTPYGQQVMLLEYKGKFAEVANSKGTAEIKVVG